MKTEIDAEIERLCEVYRKGMQSVGVWPDWEEALYKNDDRAGIRAVYEAVLADVRPMPDRLEVANALNDARYEGRYDNYRSWEDDIPSERKREAEAMLKLFAGRTDADHEKLERVNEQLQEDVAELRRGKESVQRACARLTAERDALAAELNSMTADAKAQHLRAEAVTAERDALAAERDALKSHAAELTDDEVERLCEVWGAADGGICDAIRVIARELPRLPWTPPEGVTREGLAETLRDIHINANSYPVIAGCVCDYLNITLPTAPTVVLDGPQTAAELRAALNQLEEAS